MSVPLLTSVDCTQQIHVIIGDNGIAAKRVTRSHEAGATCLLISPTDIERLHFDLKNFIETKTISHVQREFQEEDLKTFGRQEVDGVVDMVFVTLPPHDKKVSRISSLCKRLRIPVNCADSPKNCTFSLLSTHRDGPLQIGISTSGKGCKLASRIRREVVSSLPPNLGATCTLLGSLRTQLQTQDGLSSSGIDDDSEQPKSLNTLILDEEDYQTSKTRRMRWLTQICEYYPLAKLCQLSSSDITNLLDQYRQDEGYVSSSSDISVPILPPRRGQITLVGSGPGHPDLLTQAALRAINTADLVLADKLVPAEILALIPRRTEVYIARKFPGNAEKAQEELQSRGLTALNQGKRVMRLKQGDPYIFGRGGEEYLFFESHGYEVDVIPGLTSALTATALAGITATHRGVADQVLICTGTGRRGALPQPPEYVKSRTAVFLMALHRVEDLVSSLVGAGWPDDIPCAVVERASCRDQRVIRTQIKNVAMAIEREGSRPPGLLVVGWGCRVLKQLGEKDKWVVEEGLSGNFWSNGGDDIVKIEGDVDGV